MDAYAVIGVPASATDAQIRDAYLRRSKELHPDRFASAPAADRDAATRAMQELNAAYDALRHRGAGGAGAAAAAPSPPSYARSYAAATAQPTWAAPPKRRMRWAVVIIVTLLISTCLALLSGTGGSHHTLPRGSTNASIDLRQTEGECLTFDSTGNPDEIVDCTRPHGARIMRVVAHGSGCPVWTDRTVAESAQDLCLDTHQ